MSLDVILRSAVDVGGDQPEMVTWFEANITHNLNKMATHAGIYEQLWRPEEVDAMLGGDLIEALSRGLQDMKARPDHYRQFEAANGWGTYDQFVPWVEKYLDACVRFPAAAIEISR